MTTFDALFKAQDTRGWLQGEIEVIALMSGRRTPSGYAAFGYPYSVSEGFNFDGSEVVSKSHNFFSTMITVEVDDIPAVIQEIEGHGFELSAIRNSEWDEEGRTLIFTAPIAREREQGLFHRNNGERIA